MSEPTIWDIAMGGNPPEKFVPYADYARLKAEVERLRKAGDAMELTLQADFNGCPYEPLIVSQAIHYWRAAKEGKPSV